MSAPPRNIARWAPRLECSRPLYGRSLVTASVLFAFLLVVQLAVVAQLVSRDLSRQHIIQSLQAYRADLQQLQKRVDEIMKEEGKYDLFALKEKLTVLTRAVNERYFKQLAIDHLAVYDVQGRRVVAVTGLRKSLIPRPQPAPLEPKFRTPGEMPDTSTDTPSGPQESHDQPGPPTAGNLLAAGGAQSPLSPAGAGTPQPAPGAGIPPSAPGAGIPPSAPGAGTPPSGAGTDGSLPMARDGAPEAPIGQDGAAADSRPTGPAGAASAVGPPEPPGRIHMDSATRETLILVPVGTGSGGDPKGFVELGVNRELLESEAADLWRNLMKKLVAGAFLSLVLLVVGFLYVLKLLQKTRRLEAEAQMADRLAYIGTLASGLAHEIRNPLNAMNMNLQMIEEEFTIAGERAHLPGSRPQQAIPPPAPPPEPAVPEPPGDDTRALLESTRGEIRRLERLVSSFLAYARPSSLKLEERDLNQTVDDVVRFLQAELASSGIQLAAHWDAALPVVALDEAQFRQAILNILVNARQVLPPGGRIELATGRTLQGEIFLRIADNGPGISPEQLERIFEVFYSTRRGGTGLGLPIAQRIVQNHGGRIEVESESGTGTAFTIILPPHPRPAGASAPAPEPARVG